MTEQEWIVKAKEHATVLRQLIVAFHPNSRGFGVGRYEPELEITMPDYLPITAPNAEMAARTIRAAIKKEQKPDPLLRFDRALEAGDSREITSVLNGAWFGVPESTSCWEVEGFKEAVDLLEDPPDPPDDFEVSEEQANDDFDRFLGGV